MDTGYTPQASASPTARSSEDKMGLGRTSGQRGAEILAGVRAEMTPSPEAQALSRLSGRITARMFMKAVRQPAIINFPAVRSQLIRELIQRAMPERSEIAIVEIAAGLSPRGLHLARDLPNAKIIEIDLPDVIFDKQSRLKGSAWKRLDIPTNIEWRGADLGVVSLESVLKGQKVDIVVAEGLMSYFPHDEMRRIARQVYDNLLPGGAYICDIAWKSGIFAASEASRLFSRQAGEFAGMVDTLEESAQVLTDAGYRSAEAFRPSVMAEELQTKYNLPLPINDFTLINIGYK